MGRGHCCWGRPCSLLNVWSSYLVLEPNRNCGISKYIWSNPNGTSWSRYCTYWMKRCITVLPGASLSFATEFMRQHLASTFDVLQLWHKSMHIHGHGFRPLLSLAMYMLQSLFCPFLQHVFRFPGSNFDVQIKVLQKSNPQIWHFSCAIYVLSAW